VIFARSPVPRRCKTRLIPLLGAKGAARFQLALSLDVFSKIRTVQASIVPYMALTGAGFRSESEWKAQIASFTLLRQRGGDLGERLERVFRLLLQRHTYVVAVGTDSPELSLNVIRKAFQSLRVCQAALGPCPDGGYYLVGLRRILPSDRLKQVFRGVRWGTRWALRDSLRNLTSVGLSCALLETVADIDRPSDVKQLFERMSMKRSSRQRAPSTWDFLRLCYIMGRRNRHSCL
jgi:rSAM/selenodomain-associated transferase 1